jgi:DNA-binding phage protein
MLYVVKLIVDAVVAGRADPASGVPEADWLADPGLRHRPIGRSTNDGKGGGVKALTRSFKGTVKARAERDPAFRDALLTEAVDQFLAGDLKSGKAVLRDYINATIGFERLAEETGSSPKSLMRMLSPSGNPTASNLFSVLSTVQRAAGVYLAVAAGR